jgi:hypothetical protein
MGARGAVLPVARVGAMLGFPLRGPSPLARRALPIHLVLVLNPNPALVVREGKWGSCLCFRSGLYVGERG